MADENSTRNNIILIVLLILNMAAVTWFGLFLFREHKSAETAEKQKAAGTPVAKTDTKLEDTATTEPATQSPYTKKIVKFESLITNLAGNQGRREVRMTLEARCEGESVLAELTSQKPRVRDIIVGDVGNQTAEDLSTNEGKEKFKIQLREDINAVLKKGKITEVYITELQLN